MAASPRRLEWSASARSDLLAIDAWYAQFGEATAERVIQSIVAAANSLSQYPFSGPEGIRPGTRHKVAGAYPYSLVYRVSVLREEIAEYPVKRSAKPRAR